MDRDAAKVVGVGLKLVYALQSVVVVHTHMHVVLQQSAELTTHNRDAHSANRITKYIKQLLPDITLRP